MIRQFLTVKIILYEEGLDVKYLYGEKYYFFVICKKDEEVGIGDQIQFEQIGLTWGSFLWLALGKK